MPASYVEEFTREVAINARTTALLVIGMQNATGNPELDPGALLRKQGRFDGARYRFDRIERTAGRTPESCSRVSVLPAPV